jgi:hypothetical protein
MAATQQPVRRRGQAVSLCEVGIGQRHVALDHVERRVAQNALEAERDAAVDQIRAREGVAQAVRAAAAGNAGARLEPLEDLLYAASAERAAARLREAFTVGDAPDALPVLTEAVE